MTPKTSPLKVMGDPVNPRICSRFTQSSSPHSPGFWFKAIQDKLPASRSTLPTRPLPKAFRALGSSNTRNTRSGTGEGLAAAGNQVQQRFGRGHFGLWGPHGAEVSFIN